MDKEFEQTFLQRIYTNGQQEHDKMLNIISLQGNANQNQNEIPLLTHQDGHFKKQQKQQKITSVDKDVEKFELYTLLMGM